MGVRCREVHSDWSQGIRHARKEVFPLARPWLDYALMVRQVRSELQVHLRTCCTAEAEEPTRTGVRLSARARPRVKLHLQPIMKLIQLTRFLPSLQLFDAIWQVLLVVLRRRWNESGAAEYLFKHYFEAVPPNVMRRLARVGEPAFGAPTFWFAGFWSGCLGTSPGTASGSQTVEAFHRGWHTVVDTVTRRDVRLTLPEMQRIYSEVWAKEFAWGKPSRFDMRPAEVNSMLLSSPVLHRLNRSTAVDFWDSRALPNFQHVQRGTGATRDAPAHVSDFWVMQCFGHDGVAPASQKVERKAAELVCDLICATGPELSERLTTSGIVAAPPSAWTCHLNVPLLEEVFGRRAVVIRGEIVNRYWPRLRRQMTQEERAASYLCSCQAFGAYYECEHRLFVRCLRDDGINLAHLPVRRRGVASTAAAGSATSHSQGRGRSSRR